MTTSEPASTTQPPTSGEGAKPSAGRGGKRLTRPSSASVLAGLQRADERTSRVVSLLGTKAPDGLTPLDRAADLARRRQSHTHTEEITP